MEENQQSIGALRSPSSNNLMTERVSRSVQANPLFLIVISAILGAVLGYLMGQLAGVLKPWQ